nr:MAG TPA: hypothetical protein [Caudoviricetes sp.]
MLLINGGLNRDVYVLDSFSQKMQNLARELHIWLVFFHERLSPCITWFIYGYSSGGEWRFTVCNGVGTGAGQENP